MSFQPGIDASIEIIGGLVCDMAASELPPGVSPDCQDVWFPKSAAETRGGLTSQFGALAGNPTVNYLKTYEKADGTLRLMVFDSLGNLFKENPAGTLASVQGGVGPQSPWANSTTIFNREYLAFSDGKIGQDIPRQFDDVNLDRVSQVGPGAAPAASDEAVAWNLAASPNGAIAAIANIANSPNGATQVGFVVTIKTAIISGWLDWLRVGDSVQVVGVGIAGYNGTFVVTSVSTDGQTFQYVNTVSGLAASGGGTVNFPFAEYTPASGATPVAYVDGQLINVSGVTNAVYNANGQTVRAANFPNTVGYGGYPVGSPEIVAFIGAAIFGATASGGGSVTNAGNIVAGVHEISVIFVTRQQFLTAPAPFGKWTAGGGKRVVVTNIPTGPPNVIQRILIFTGAGGASFFYATGASATIASSDMVIPDNTTTTVTVDFTDAVLLGGTNVDALFNQVELGECAGVIDYKQRVFWWGERAKIPNFNNLTFDGGFGTDSLGRSFPLGWTQDTVNYAGGGSALGNGQPAVWGDAYAIGGNGATAVRGLITQTAVKDFRGVPILQANTAVNARFRARWAVTSGGAPTAGSLKVEIFSASAGSLGLVSIAFNVLTNAYVEYNQQLLAAQAAIPSDTVLRVYADGTPDNRTIFLIDNLEPYIANQTVNASLVRASRVENPESFDGVTGLLLVAENNGQALRAAFKLRERLYFVKEHSLHVTQDDASNEPNGWSVDEVSKRVGTPSVRGVAVGPDWAVIAHRSGLYIFSGGEPWKLCQEVMHSASGRTLAWDQINWQYGHTLWVVADPQEKRIYVGAPFGAATSPNDMLVMDYRDIDPENADTIGTSPAVVSSYQGKKIVKEKSRKWSPWTISANSAALVERFDGTQQLFLGAGAFGNQTNSGKIYKLDAANLTDDGKAIPSYYLTAFVPQRETEQLLQLHAHRKLFTYLSMYVEGNGTLNCTAFPANEAFSQILPNLTLSNPASRDLEMTINVIGERVAFKVAADLTVPGNWFRLQKLTPSVTGDPHAPVRGQN